MAQRRVFGRALGSVVLGVAIAAAGLGPASAAPTSGTAPVRRLVAAAERHVGSAHARDGARQALRLADVPVTEADDYYLGVDPGCVKGTGKAKANAEVLAPRKLTLDYTLTGTGRLRTTGTVKVTKDRPAAIALPKLGSGSYRLVLTAHGSTAPVADETFDVYRCVSVRASCHAVTFTNPPGNPAAVVSYGGKEAEDYDVEVAAGASRTVRVDRRTLVVEASAAADDDYVDLGSAKVKVKQSCQHGPAQPDQNAVQTQALVGCAGATRATVSLSWSAQASLKNRRWEVLDLQQRVVAHGSYKDGRHAEARLGGGTYAYRSYANALARPFEDLSFTVLGCITVTARCRALDVTNPNAVPVHLLVFSTEEDPDLEGSDPEDAGSLTVAAAATTTVPWTSRTASYLALATDLATRTAFVSLASEWLTADDDLAEITVPQDC